MKTGDKISEILKADEGSRVYWRIQDSRYPLPKTSWSGWDGYEYPAGAVSFYANLINAVEALSGEEDDSGFSAIESIVDAGGTPALVAATSKEEIEDGPGSEVILHDPEEIGRWVLSEAGVASLLDQI